VAETSVSTARGPLSVSVGEVTGALGDSVTVLPIVVAVCALTPASLPHVLLAFGVFQVAWGVTYGVPMSVEPMKALAGLAIAGSITYPELAAAGLLVGAVLLVAGATGALSRLASLVGEPTVRGVQLAVALLLARAGVEAGLASVPLAAAGVAVVAVLTVAGRSNASALAVLGVGVALAVGRTGAPAPALPALSVFPTGTPALTGDALAGAAGQLAMTVGNAAVATAALCADLFDRDVSPDALGRSMGVTCLAAIPAGGLPMCHGSGGLAGKHEFGARTGGANLVLGGLYLAAVPIAGVVAAFPTPLLGVLLGVVALGLARTALDVGPADPDGGRDWGALAVTVAVGVVGLAWNVGAAFLLGLVAGRVRSRLASAG